MDRFPLKPPAFGHLFSFFVLETPRLDARQWFRLLSLEESEQRLKEAKAPEAPSSYQKRWGRVQKAAKAPSALADEVVVLEDVGELLLAPVGLTDFRREAVRSYP